MPKISSNKIAKSDVIYLTVVPGPLAVSLDQLRCSGGVQKTRHKTDPCAHWNHETFGNVEMLARGSNSVEAHDSVGTVVYGGLGRSSLVPANLPPWKVDRQLNSVV